MPSSSSRLICSCSKNSNTTIPAFRDLRLFLFSGPIIAHGREFASFFCEFSGWQTFKEMEVKGYLQKQASAEDGRVTYLTITDAGRALSAR